MTPHHGGSINTLEGRNVIQTDFSKLQKWADRNIMELSSGRLKSIMLGGHLNVTFNFLNGIYREDGARLFQRFKEKGQEVMNRGCSKRNCNYT